MRPVKLEPPCPECNEIHRGELSVNWPGRAVGADGDVDEFRSATTLGDVQHCLKLALLVARCIFRDGTVRPVDYYDPGERR